MSWTARDLPDLSAHTVVVTGANSGIGLEATRALAAKGAEVVLACRDASRGIAAAESIRSEAGADVQVEVLPLDLASLASVRDFAKALADRHPRIDVLANNAGVMALPLRRTADGFEMQFGTNHLGHFALTGLLLPQLLAAPDARVVNVSSAAHQWGRMDFDDPNWERRRYSKWRAYGQSKLANLLFSYELERRFAAVDANVRSVACHPGYAATNLQTAGPRMQGSSLQEYLMLGVNRVFSQSAEMGALPTLYAAFGPYVAGGDYIGPDGFQQMWGHPTQVQSSRPSRDEGDAGRLWALSEQLTGERYEALAS